MTDERKEIWEMNDKELRKIHANAIREMNSKAVDEFAKSIWSDLSDFVSNAPRYAIYALLVIVPIALIYIAVHFILKYW